MSKKNTTQDKNNDNIAEKDNALSAAEEEVVDVDKDEAEEVVEKKSTKKKPAKEKKEKKDAGVEEDEVEKEEPKKDKDADDKDEPSEDEDVEKEDDEDDDDSSDEDEDDKKKEKSSESKKKGKKESKDDEKKASAKKKKKPVKTKKVYLVLALLLIAASVVVFFTVGLVPAKDHMPYSRYTAAIPFEFDMETLPALQDAIAEAAGVPVEVNVFANLGAGNSGLEILVIPAGEIDEKAVVNMLNEKYEEMNIDSLTSGVYSSNYTVSKVLTLLFVYAVVLLLTFIISAFIVDGRNALNILLSTVLSTLMVMALYVVCRVPVVRLLIVGVLVVCIMVPYLGITKLRSLQASYIRIKKPKAPAIVADDTEENGPAGVDLLVVAAFAAVAFAVLGIWKGALPLAYFGVMLVAAVGCSVYTTALVTPVIWAGSKKK